MLNEHKGGRHMRVLSLPEGKLGLFSVVCAEVSVSVVDTETTSVATCTVVVGGSCVVVAGNISVVALLNSVVEVLDTTVVVFGVVSSLTVVASLVVTLLAFDLLVEAATVK